MSPEPKLSIVVVNFNAVDFLRSCIHSIHRGIDVPYEICVVDNASKDKSLEYLKKECPEVLVVGNTENRGFAAAINQGIAATKAPFVLWLNPDTEILEGSFLKTLKLMEEDPHLGILGLQILNPDRSIQLSCRSFPSYETAFFNRYSLMTRLFPQNPLSRKYLKTGDDHSRISPTDWVSGACLLHKRSMIDSLGGLDERFFMYCEDVDFCKRAQSAGWKVLYDPDVKILHHIAGSSRQVPQKMIFARHRSMWLYYAKNFSRNFIKDFIVASVITFRCIFLSFLHGFKSVCGK